MSLEVVMRRRLAVLSSVAVCCLASSATAAGTQGRWAFELRGGLDVALSGDVHTGASGRVLGLPTTVEARSYGDVYGSPFRIEGALAYGVAPRVELFGQVGYAQKEADVLKVGTVAGLDLNAQFFKYKEWSVAAGLRYHLTEAGQARPYLVASGGVKFVNDIPATFTVPAASVTLTKVPFYDKSTVGTFGAGLGLEFELTDTLGLGIETGLHYQGKLEGLEGLAGTGLESINDVGSRWYVPITAGFSLRF
jgi:hypothetical protein